jgi:hypothetical protein
METDRLERGDQKTNTTSIETTVINTAVIEPPRVFIFIAPDDLLPPLPLPLPLPLLGAPAPGVPEEPPALAESSANPTEKGLARKTVYTFFLIYICISIMRRRRIH